MNAAVAGLFLVFTIVIYVAVVSIILTTKIPGPCPQCGRQGYGGQLCNRCRRSQAP